MLGTRGYSHPLNNRSAMRAGRSLWRPGCRRLPPCGKVNCTLSMILALWGLGMTNFGAAQQVSPDEVQRRLEQYAVVRLTTDFEQLSDNERRVIGLLIEAARHMDPIFWQQSYGSPDELLGRLTHPGVRRFAEINYGPWDRLNGNEPFVPGIGPKPLGAQFYPTDMTKEEFEQYVADHPDEAEALKSLYTLVRRTPDGGLRTIPYHEAFADHTAAAAEKLREAARITDDNELASYLRMRAEALETSDYQASDRAWMDMKNNRLDIVIGPIETYEDRLFGYKAAHEAYVLVKDTEWSERLQRYAELLPELQGRLPVDERYKQEKPGSDSDLNAYDVLFYAGDCNAGAKTIAINLPNDEQVQLEKGTRRLQLKNAMRAKYEKILVPLSQELIHPDQRAHITFDAFFGNVMFHEVAHGLGIKNTITGQGTVREALRDLGPALEEGKADILGLHMVGQLRAMKVLEEGDQMDNYVTFLAGIFRSVRFGASSAHGRANLVAFNFFERHKAFTRGDDGTYRVNPEQMQKAVKALSARILQLQGDGDYAAVRAFMDEMGTENLTLKADLERANRAAIPVDIVFEQG